MPRQPNLEIRLKCLNWNDFTQTICPIIICKLTENRYHIKAVCSICNKFKSKFLNKEQIKLLPNEIQQAADKTTFSKTIQRNGSALPLFTLIPAIIAGISAWRSVAGTTASVVLGNKQANEEERYNKAVEQIAQGGELINDVIKMIIIYKQ